jgi:DNA-binding CsgD family transcriptional regulator
MEVMAMVTPDRVRDDVGRLVERRRGIRDFCMEAARILGRAVPHDGVCVLTMDPETRVPTGEIVEGGLPPEATRRMAAIEMRGDDVNAFEALAAAHMPTASLFETTNGELDRSVRHREVRSHHGFGDELRALLVTETGVWGALTLLRSADHDPFTRTDTALVASVSERLARGLCQSLVGVIPSARGDEEAAGLLTLAADDSVLMLDAAAQHWLCELAPERTGTVLPGVVVAVASRARAAHGPGRSRSQRAQARVRTASRKWLTVRGSVLGDAADAPVGVVLEPARVEHLASMFAAACQLTERERTITELIAGGLATDEIAQRLLISPWTVQDHLKSIFEKVGVRTRGELVASIYFHHAPPRLDNRQTRASTSVPDEADTSG